MPGERRAPAQRGEHRAGAQHRAEQLLGMADVERAQRDRVGGAQAHDDGDRAAAGAAREQARGEHDAERRAGEQARRGDGAEDGDLAAAEARRPRARTARA